MGGRDRDRRGGEGGRSTWEERQKNREERERDREEQFRKAEEMGVEIPKYFKAGGVQPVSYAEQVLKRKMLWAKPTAAPTSAAPHRGDSGVKTSWNKWEATNFGDGKKNEKFRRLMGIKTAPPPDIVQKTVHTPHASTALNSEQQERIQSELEMNYEAARNQTHRNRGLGLGFSSMDPYQPMPQASHDPLAMAGFVRKNH